MKKKLLSPQSVIRDLKPILRAHGVKKAALFGSFARGEARKTSDVDLLVEFRSGKSLLDLVHLRRVLEDSLGRSVDVATFQSLHPRIKESVRMDLVQIL